MHALKVRQIGNSEGVVLPKEVLAKLGANSGDTLYVTEVAGGVKLSVYDDETAEQIRQGEEILTENRTALRALSKS